MFARLLLLFTLVPVVELVLLIWLGGRIGFLPTVGLILLTAVVGAYLARREGMNAWNRFQRRLASGELPGRELTDGLIVLVSGALLLTPGVLTDVVGLLGLFPVTRAGLRRYVTRAMERGIARGSIRISSFGGFPGASTSFTPGPSASGAAASDREDIQDATFEEYERPGRAVRR